MESLSDKREQLIARVYSQGSRADAETCSMEDLEAGASILDRVMDGTCQNCGMKEGCTCLLLDSTEKFF